VDLTGKPLGQYQVQQELGRGGMAVVYRAFQASLHRSVAIKVLPPQFTFDESFVHRFLQEARSAAGLRHPNIVTIYDVGVQDDIHYIVMEELAGESLSKLIDRQGKQPADRVANVISQIGSALDYAHARGIVHRDVKPSNIIVGTGDHATLTDFGIAKAIEGTQLTQTGMMVGTPEYMSPEQAKGDTISSSSDVYSLGLVAYEMLAGQTPFVADSAPAILYKQVHERAASVRTFAPDLSPDLDSVLANALAKKTADRYSSAGAFAQDLQSVAQGSATILAHALPSAKHPPSAIPKRRLPGRIFFAASAIVILLLAVLGVSGFFNSRNRPPATVVVQLEETSIPVPTRTLAPIITFTPQQKKQSPAVVTVAVGSPREEKPKVYTNQDINVYAGPGRDYTKVGLFDTGEEKEIVATSQDGDWWQVCCVGGDPVWIAAHLVQVTGDASSVPEMVVASPTKPAPTQSPTYTPTPRITNTPAPKPTITPATADIVINRDTINVRSGPGKAYTEVGKARRGQKYRITGRNAGGSWWQIDYKAKRGWVSMALVTEVGVTNKVVVATAPPKPTAASKPSTSANACRSKFSQPSVQLLEPRSDLVCNGPVRFSWQWSTNLQSGEMYEIHIWPERKQNRDRVIRTLGRSAVIDLRKDVHWIDWNDRPHRWEVIVVCAANGNWISHESEPRLFYFGTMEPVDEGNPDVNCR